MWACAHGGSRAPGRLTRGIPNSLFAGSDTDRVRRPSCRAGFHRPFSPLWRCASPSALRTTVSPRPQPETLDSERVGVRPSVSWDAAPPPRAPRPAGLDENARAPHRTARRSAAHWPGPEAGREGGGGLSRANRQLSQPISFSDPCYACP